MAQSTPPNLNEYRPPAEVAAFLRRTAERIENAAESERIYVRVMLNFWRPDDEVIIKPHVTRKPNA